MTADITIFKREDGKRWWQIKFNNSIMLNLGVTVSWFTGMNFKVY